MHLHVQITEVQMIMKLTQQSACCILEKAISYNVLLRDHLTALIVLLEGAAHALPVELHGIIGQYSKD